MKIATIVGARPQFIKTAPVSKILRDFHTEVLIHTGQHYDKKMSDIFFEELNIPVPDYNLGIRGNTHGQMTGQMIIDIENLLLEIRPDSIMVYGDTNTTIAGALAASKLKIPIMHVEAGLRSYNKSMPEEQNRIVADHLSYWLSCPTQNAVNNLFKEGITENVINTGDVMLDAVEYFSKIAEEKKNIDYIFYEIKDKSKMLISQNLRKDEYYLITIHRAENTDNLIKLETIINSLNQLPYLVIWPVHPRIKNILNNYKLANHIILIEPVGYLEMLQLTKFAKMIITDSGGLQKEAFFLKTPCTTLRDQTEWIETLNGGWNILTEISVNSILQKVTTPRIYDYDFNNSVFGDGNAATKIATLFDR